MAVLKSGIELARLAWRLGVNVSRFAVVNRQPEAGRELWTKSR